MLVPVVLDLLDYKSIALFRCTNQWEQCCMLTANTAQLPLVIDQRRGFKATNLLFDKALGLLNISHTDILNKLPIYWDPCG